MSVTDQFLSLFVPQPIRKGLQARHHGDRFNLLEERIGAVAFFQVVIGDTRAQMVNMMKTDVARKPLQYAGQFIKRAALQGR